MDRTITIANVLALALVLVSGFRWTLSTEERIEANRLDIAHLRQRTERDWELNRADLDDIKNTLSEFLQRK